MALLQKGRYALGFQHWLWLGFAVIIALMVAITAIGIQRVNAIDEALTRINDVHGMKQRYAIDFRGSVHDRAIALRDVVGLTTNSAVQEQLDLIKALEEDYAEAESALTALLTTHDDISEAEREAYAQIQRIAESTQAAVAEVLAFRSTNNLSAARFVLFEDAAPRFKQWLGDINAFIDLQEARSVEETRAARELTGTFQATMLVLVGLAIVISLIIAALPGRWLKRTLGATPEKVRERVQTIGSGDFSTAANGVSASGFSGNRFSENRFSENSIMQALSDMTQQLSETVNRVRLASFEVENDSYQISDNSTELLSRVEQQASMLTQSATAMEQLGSTVAHNAERARQVDHQASDAAALAGEGGAMVKQVESAMQALNTRSEEVVTIVSLIDSIAFQTNILALNASVEAARAGEAGRGFAVVAQEVRNLATRSAEASRQISELIHANLQQVTESVSLVNKASDKTHRVVEAINRVTALVGEISQASAEQARAVQEVGQAVTQMDGVTQQNADLVKQTAATGEELRLRSSQLGEAIARFDLDEDQLQPRARTVDEINQQHELAYLPAY
ncbi:MAG: methyl-accepting chemotaxis protein [Pseudomonadota bacterium]